MIFNLLCNRNCKYLLLNILFISTVFGNQKLSIKDRVEKSDLVVIGTVTNIKSKWNEKKTRIWTYVTIETTECLKGKIKTNKVKIRVLGGQVGEIRMDVSHGVKFDASEKVLVFLGKDIEDYYYVSGWNEGKYKYENNELVNCGKKLPLSFVQEIKNIITNNSK